MSCMQSTVSPVTDSGTRRNAIVFLTLYLQLLGMNDAAASALMALFLGGSALGGLLGGWLGDKAAQASAQPEVISLLQLCTPIAIFAAAQLHEPSWKYLIQLVVHIY